MTSTYARVRKALADQRQADGDVDTASTCRVCSAVTDREVLSRLGGRCSTCYGHYLRAPREHPPLPDVPSRSNPRAWALRLQARENAGERLTHVQRAMWRQALRVHASTKGEDDAAA
jgi:hypothetical protein